MRLINIKTLKLEEFSELKIPPYAILSHTWGADSQELSFRDVEDGKIHKPGAGSTKFQGCCEQAKKDGLDYAWIDTCCIDKTNLVELSEAINSMFRWYSRASVCYAYMSDVPYDDVDDNESKFQESRWFHRGWTLQELLAPRRLRFYDAAWRHIGTKRSLCSVIHNITRVPHRFLVGAADLHSASVAQRMSWAAQRDTKRAEDRAYCLLGIFGVTMPMIYGEGGEQAFFRLQEQIMKTTRDDSILAWDLSFDEQSTASSDQAIGGAVLAAAPSYFANSGQIITRQHADNPRESLDVSGGTLRLYMPVLRTYDEIIGLLSCGPESDDKQRVGIPLTSISLGPREEYFRLTGRPSILQQVPKYRVLSELIHIRIDGPKDGPMQSNSWCWLYEGDEDAEINIELVDVAPPSRWDKERALIWSGNDLKSNSTDQVLARFRHKRKFSQDFVVTLELRSGYSTKPNCDVMICSRDTTLEELAERIRNKRRKKQSASNGLFHLRVDLKQIERQIVLIRLEATPRPPDETIDLALEIQKLHLTEESLCLLEEITIGGKATKPDVVKSKLRGLEMKREKWVNEELTSVQETHHLDEGLEFRKYQGAALNQWLYAQNKLDKLYDLYTSEDVYRFSKQTLLSYAVENSQFEAVMLLLDANTDPNALNVEGLTLLTTAINSGDLDMARLLLDTPKTDVNAIDNDGRTALDWATDRGHEVMIQLLLENGSNINRRWHTHTLKPSTRHFYNSIPPVAFSHDSKLVALGTRDGLVELLNATTGERIHVFRATAYDRHIRDYCLSSLAFSHDSKLLALGSSNGIAEILDAATGKSQNKLNTDTHASINSVAFSHDDSELEASGPGSWTMKLSELTRHNYSAVIHKDYSVLSMAFSHDSKLKALGYKERTVGLRDTSTDQYRHMLPGHDSAVCSVAFSHDSKMVASGSKSSDVKLWDTTTGQCLHTLQGHSGVILTVAFSHDSKLVASGSDNGTAKLWNTATGQCQLTIETRESGKYSVAFSPDLKLWVLWREDRTLVLSEMMIDQMALAGRMNAVLSI